ncbi:MAG: response regulator [Salinarimonadaceae bacterium]|nr:MAG: response regulator [Salinarimonadaceae bacterium]
MLHATIQRLPADEALREALQEVERLRQREARAAHEAAVLLGALTAMTRSNRPDAAVSALLRVASEAVGAAAACMLRRRRRDGLCIVEHATEGELRGLLPARLAGLLGKPRRVPDVSATGWFEGEERFAPFAALAAVPIPQPDGRSVSLLCLSERPAAFGPDCLRLLARMAELAGAALTTVALAERKALLAAVIEGSTASISIADARGKDAPLIYVNPAFARLSGHAPEDVLARNCRLLAADDPDAPERVRLRAAVAGRRRGRFLLRNRRKDGTLFWNELDLDPVPEEGSGARYLVATQKDVTEAVENQGRLNTLNARLADIAALSDTYFWESDGDLRWTFISQAADRILGVNSQDLIGVSLEEMLHAVPALRAGGDWDGVLRTVRAGAPIRGFTFRPHGVARRDVVLQINGRPFHGPDGRLMGYRGVASDVTEIIAARDAAEQAGRAKSEFLAAMSHELRTPLTGILGNLELLIDKLTTDEKRAIAAEIGQAGAKLDVLLGDVLDLARLETGRLELEPGPLVPADVVARAASAHRQAAADKGLQFETLLSGPTDLPRRGDARRLVQVLHHLLSNAVKFTASGGVRLRLDAVAPDRLEIEVADTGIGIEPSDRARVFDSFRQLDGGTGRAFGGSGIGLAIVGQLVALMGGEIRLEGALGQGTQVRLTLPMPLERIAKAPSRTDLARPLAALSVLVADDTAANRKILSAMLRRLGATVCLCSDGCEALAAASREAFGVALLDINMPGLDGVALIRAIRAHEAATGAPRLPAIAVTANAHPDQVAAYLAAGFDDCVGKPFGVETLKAAILRTLAGETGARDP